MSTPTTAPESPKTTAAKKRAKIRVLHSVLRNADDFAATVSRYATAELILAGQRLEAEAEVKALMERHNARIERTQAELAELFESIEDYARRHRADLFTGEEKTITVNGHEIAFRTGNPTIATAKGTTQKAVLLALLEHEDSDWADPFIRWKESLNKDAMLDQYNTETGTWKEGGQALADLGVIVEQTERFHLKTARALDKPSTTTGEAQTAA